jgi:hypothetical protein
LFITALQVTGRLSFGTLVRPVSGIGPLQVTLKMGFYVGDAIPDKGAQFYVRATLPK